MPIEPADLDLATLAFVVGTAANEHLLSAVRDAGYPDVRIAHGYVFQRLLEGTPTVGELATALGVTQQAASKSARELERLGYVVRRTDPADGRVTRLELSARGRGAVEAARSARAELERELAALVGDTRVAATRDVLTTLLDHVGGVTRVRRRAVRPPD